MPETEAFRLGQKAREELDQLFAGSLQASIKYVVALKLFELAGEVMSEAVSEALALKEESQTVH